MPDVPVNRFIRDINGPELNDADVVVGKEQGNVDVVNGLEKAKMELRNQGLYSEGSRHPVDIVIDELNEKFPGDWAVKKLTLAGLRTLRGSGAPLCVGHVRSAVATLEAGRLGALPAKVGVVMVGGGPRSTAQENAYIDFFLSHEKDCRAIEALGGKYDHSVNVIIDEQGFENLGRGHAWGEGHEGMQNTGAEFDHGERFADFAKRNKSEIAEAARHNPLLDLMLGDATRSKQPGFHRAALTRNLVGKEETQYTKQKIAEQAATGTARHQTIVMDNTRVKKVNVAPEPSVQLDDAERTVQPGNVEGTVQPGNVEGTKIWARSVRLNTGTTLASPIRDHDVKQHSYTGYMNHRDLGEKLQEKGLLDDGKLKEGAKILMGGSGLSLYDQLTALQPCMGWFEEDPSAPMGYRISDEAKQKYKGAITVTSNTPGKWIPPRHSHSPNWTQDVEPLGNIEEQHALFLHNQGEQVFDAWETIAEASCAAATGKLPADVREEGLTTEELLNRYNEASIQHEQGLKSGNNEETHTLYGARRQAKLSTILGFGMSRDVGSAIARMDEIAPLTFKGRGGYLMLRAQLKGISEPGTEVAQANQQYIDVFSKGMQDVTASPFNVHSMMHKLVEAGIATYTPGSYSDIKARAGAAGEGKPLTFTDKKHETTEYDLFVVSQTFQRQKNSVVESLAGQVDPIASSTDPDTDAVLRTYGKIAGHRMLISSTGERTPVTDQGLGGKGVRLNKNSVIGIFAFDVNNRESASQSAVGETWLSASQETLEAAGDPNAVETVESLYEELLPKDDAFENEAESFKQHYYDAMQKAAYLKIIAERARTTGAGADTYGQWYEKGRTQEGRMEVGGTDYEDAIKTIPPYKPSTKSDFFKRFVDSPDWAHEMVYTKSVLLASSKLLNQRFNKDAQGNPTAVPKQGNVRGGVTGAREWHGETKDSRHLQMRV